MGASSQRFIVDMPPTGASEFLSDWAWLLREPMNVVAISALGDGFLSDASGHIHWLDVASGTLIEIAESAAIFDELRHDPLAADELFAPALVTHLVAANGPLRPGTCFSITIPLSLGGKLEPANFRVMGLGEHFKALAKIQEQVSQLPVGAKIDRVQMEK